ncbi:MAG TPA: hypothetical protein VGD54_10260 [Steroidobacteraceae bacterium]
MKTFITASMLLLGSILTVHFVLGADSSDRPARVAAKNWIPISDRLGFVLDPPTASQGVWVAPGSEVLPTAGPRLLLATSPPLEGYFVAKTQTGWRRLAVTQPSDLLH